MPKSSYSDLLDAFDREFTYTFGGCSIVRDLDGSYLSQAGYKMQDRVNVIYTDIPLNLEKGMARISKYADRLRVAAFEALEEEAILVTALTVYHST
ncbi:MAG: hypothetical protein ACREDR_18585 [Blastocatellia bacterium]